MPRKIRSFLVGTLLIADMMMIGLWREQAKSTIRLDRSCKTGVPWSIYFCMLLPMAAERNIRNLALIGFMGCGKSTVGRLVARDLGFRFVDTDSLVEERAGLSVSEVFRSEGEESFRELEEKVISDLAGERALVIASGGGAILNPDNLESLKTHALLVSLWAKAESIHQRTKHQHHRPLLQGDDPLGTIRKMLAEREPFYRQADVIVNTELRPQREVVAQVCHQFEESKKDA